MDLHVVKDGKITFEEALAKTGYGLYNYLMIGLAGMSTLSFVALCYGSTIIVPASACELATTSAQQGMLVAVPIAGSLVGSLLWGYLGDTRGRRRMLLASLTLGAACNALASLSVNWIMLMMIQLFTVILGSGTYVLAMTLLSESVPLQKRNTATLLVSSIFLLGQGVISVMAIPIIPLTFSHNLCSLGISWNSWRTLQAAYSLPSVLCAAALLLAQESPKYALAAGHEAWALRILASIHRTNNSRRPEELQVKGLLTESDSTEVKTGVKDQLVPLFTKPYLRSTLIMACLFTFFQILEAFLVWAPNIASQLMLLLESGEDSGLTLCQIITTERKLDTGEDGCSVNSTAMWLLLGMCALHSGAAVLLSQVVDAAGQRNTAIAVTAVCGLAGLLVNLVPHAAGTAVLFLVFSTAVVVMGMYIAIAVGLFPTHLRSMAVSMTMMGTRLMSVAFINIVNYLLENNCQLGFYIFSVLFACLQWIRRLSLPETYNGFVTACESSSDKTLSNLKSRLLLEETRKNAQPSTSSVAFKANTGMPCLKCNKKGHKAKDCRSKQCSISKKYNHPEDRCYFKDDNKNKSKKPGKVAFLSCCQDNNANSNQFEFIVDSGCSAHMTNNINTLKKLH